MMWGYSFTWGGFMMAFGMTLWIALLVVLVWTLMRWLERRAHASGQQGLATPTSHLSALEILHQRYARGEIDTATFEQMREHLQAPPVQEMSSSWQ
jgi:putative membrane protein